jgi:predicted ATPase/DNA-binding CsgD family transcriptional regulator/transcriptional regulator with XRE-family HTH domain
VEVEGSFGFWLKQCREARRLTQDALARCAGCSTIALRKIEAAERRPSHGVAERLADCLGIAPAERPKFLRFARGESSLTPPALPPWSPEQEPAQPAPRPPPDLPAPTTPLISREREVVAVGELLQRAGVRLVTLTGPGGIGKTRLAIQVAAGLAADVADGVSVVDLAPLRDPALVVSTIARSLGVQETGSRPLVEQLKAYVRAKELLLVLDNFEQVLPAARVVAEMLAAAPRLKLLVTSRALLHLVAEHEFPVPPLPVPPPLNETMDAGKLKALAQVGAVRLFMERARAVKPDLELTPAYAQAVATICRRLDGLPLALELAAARSKVLTPPALLARLDRRLQLLTSGAQDLPERQQRLRTTLDWSYQLLQPDEQVLFARLSVFVDGCTLEAAEAVVRGPWSVIRDQGLDDRGEGGKQAAEGSQDVALVAASSQHPTSEIQSHLTTDHWPLATVLDGLQSLLDKSMLRSVEATNGETRFTMLETIREYAQERLALSGEMEALRRRHAAFYLGFAEVAESGLQGPEQPAWLERVEVEHDNLRAALQWALECANAETALRISTALWWFWWAHGHLSEGSRWLVQALCAHGPVAPAVRARALNGAGALSRYLGDLARAQQLLEECLVLEREVGDTERIARTLGNLGLIVNARGDPARAQALLDETLALEKQSGDKRGMAFTLGSLGDVAYYRGNYSEATTFWEESLALHRELGDLHSVAITLNNLGEVSLAQHDHPRALAFFEESLRLAQALEGKYLRAAVLANLGDVAYERGDYRRAVTHYLESLQLREELDDKPGIAECLEGLAGVAIAPGQRAEDDTYILDAVRLFGAAAALRESSGASLSPSEQPGYARTVAAARSRLDAARFVRAWAEGQAMPIERAIASAREPLLILEPTVESPEKEAVSLPAEPGLLPADLTPREIEVLRLVAQGLTDAEVAERLVVSRRTVSSHLSSIYSKLQVTSRTAAARVAIEHGLA